MLDSDILSPCVRVVDIGNKQVRFLSSAPVIRSVPCSFVYSLGMECVHFNLVEVVSLQTVFYRHLLAKTR